MHADAVVERLATAHADISERWESLRLLWADSVGNDFERQFWGPLDTEVEVVRSRLEEFVEALAAARRVIDDS